MQTAAVLRVVAAVVLALTVACSGESAPPGTSLPPTTALPTPSEPTGAADVVRRWVQAMGERQLGAAFALLTDGAKVRAGGESGFRSARDEQEAWGRWASAEGAAFDAIPVDDDLAIVVLRGRFGEDPEEQVADADAVAVRPDGDSWAVDAFGDVGDFQADPGPGTSVRREPTLAVLVDVGVDAAVFVDGQPAEDVVRTAAGEGRERVDFRPNRPLRPGEHVAAVALVDEDGEAAARATVYVVPE